MATSEVDRQILGCIAEETIADPMLSKALFQVLGLSIILSHELLVAQDCDTLFERLSARSLHRHILWLSREGLALVEGVILPSCQSMPRTPRLIVMAVKLRASFSHIVGSFEAKVAELAEATTDQHAGSSIRLSTSDSTDVSPRTLPRTPRLREPISSSTSDSSYVTNPWAHVPVPSPPSRPIPPIVSSSLLPPRLDTPIFPPGLDITSMFGRDSTTPGDCSLLQDSPVPSAMQYFAEAAVLAKQLLPPDDPLRISVTSEAHSLVIQSRTAMNRPRDSAVAAMDATDEQTVSQSLLNSGLDIAPRLYATTDVFDDGISPSPASTSHATTKAGLETPGRAEASSPAVVGATRTGRSRIRSFERLELSEGRSRREVMVVARAGSPKENTFSVKERKRRRAERAEQHIEARSTRHTDAAIAGFF